MGVSFDQPEDNKKFREKFEFPYDLLSDTTKATSIAFGVADADARNASRMSVLIGPDDKVVKAYATVKPVEHPDQVLADLKSLA